SVKSDQHFQGEICRVFYRSGGRKVIRLSLENAAVGRLVSTKARDVVEARSLLSPKLMRSAIAVGGRQCIPIDMAFRQNLRSIDCISKKSFFKPSIFRRMKHGQVKDVYNDLCFFLSIIEELEINTRIWSK